MTKHEDELEQMLKEEYQEKDTSNKKTTPKNDDNVVETSFLETKDYILEQISNATLATHATQFQDVDNFKFVKYSKLKGDYELVKQFEHGNKVYVPIVDDALSKGGVLLPTGVSEYNSTQEIIDEIYQYISDNTELPATYEKLFPHLVLFYWLYEKFPFIPYIHFVGRTATGKTTAMETVGSICYKPIDTTGSLTIASIFRLATTWRGTLLIDEFDNVGDNSKEITSFLKSGVSNKLVFRTEGEKTKKVTAYVVKSPKLFTSENPISDAGLQSRTIVVKMEKNKRRLPLYKLNKYYEMGTSIRNKLLLWRLRNLNNIDLSKIEYGFPELEIFDRRVQQILTPIYYFSDDITKKEILKFAEEQERETKRERREAIDGKLFEIIVEKHTNLLDLALTGIAEEFNKGSKFPITEKRIAGVIRKILDFDIQRVGHEKKSTVILEDQAERITMLCAYYGMSPASVLSVASVASTANEQTELAEDIFEITS